MATTALKENTPKQAWAYARNLRISPRKMRLVTNMVKNMWAVDALTQLHFTNKKASKYVYDVIKSAMANAENNFKMNKDYLFIKEITCDSGPKLKRIFPRAQGSAAPIRRPTCHLNVLLIERKNNRKASAAFTDKKKAEKIQTAPLADNTESKNLPEKKIGTPTKIKSEEQVKANKVTQKRRLFNRKSGV